MGWRELILEFWLSYCGCCWPFKMVLELLCSLNLFYIDSDKVGQKLYIFNTFNLYRTITKTSSTLYPHSHYSCSLPSLPSSSFWIKITYFYSCLQQSSTLYWTPILYASLLYREYMYDIGHHVRQVLSY